MMKGMAAKKSRRRSPVTEAAALRAATEKQIRKTLLALFGRALRHRNFRLFTAGQSLSLIGTWMQQVAMSWLVYRLTNSELLLGVIAFAGQFPGLLMAPFAGWLVDHWNRHRIVVVAQSGNQNYYSAPEVFQTFTPSRAVYVPMARRR